MSKVGRRGFIAELMIMLVAFIFVIVIISGVFAKAKAISDSARRLSDATILACNGATIFSASEGEDEIYDILNKKDNARKEDGITSFYNDKLEPDPDGRMKMNVKSIREDGFVKGIITIYYDDQLIYELSTGHADTGGGQ